VFALFRKLSRRENGGGRGLRRQTRQLGKTTDASIIDGSQRLTTGELNSIQEIIRLG
jgi:hypothetical protein